MSTESPASTQPLRLPFGPSPWAFVGRTITIGETVYKFSRADDQDGRLAGLTFLQNGDGATLLIFDFQCYAWALDDGTLLVWRELRDRAEKNLVFDCFNIASLTPLSDVKVAAIELRESKRGVLPESKGEHFEFTTRLDAGTHTLSIPYDWCRFGETLVLADHIQSDGYNMMGRAIFAFDWSKRLVDVMPQDWFNQGNYDFGYQWITRVTRRNDGAIVGDGIRLGAFELDATNRRVKRWVTTDPFFMI